MQMRAMGLWAGLGITTMLASITPAAAADGTITLSCSFDPTESGTDPDGTVADGLGGAGIRMQYDLAHSIVRFRDGGTAPLTSADAQAIVFNEQTYTVTYRHDSGDLISHDNKTGFDATFHCLRVDGPN